MQCPVCGASVPVVAGYPNWCECGWNLERPPAPWRSDGRFSRLAARLGRNSGERLTARLRGVEELRGGWTAAKILAYAVAAGVHVFTLALLGAGVAAIVVEFPAPFSILIGVAMICLAGFMRPRVPGMPVGEPLDPATTPVLHELAGAVAAALERP